MASRRAWDKEACAECGAVYRVDRELAEKTSPVVKLFRMSRVPACPECGCVPLSNVAGLKRSVHALGFVMGWLAAPFGGLLGFNTSLTTITYSATGLTLGGLAAVLWLLHLIAALADPNSHRDRNIIRSAQMENAGLLERVSGPDDEKALGDRRSTSRWAYPLLTIGAVGVFLCFAPALLKAVRGWPENAGTKPDVAGPGDTVRVWFPKPIHAVNEIWNGTAEAEVLVEGESAPRPVTATASQQTWGNSIGGKTVHNTSTWLWADVTLPDDPALAGKRVEVRTRLTYQYPYQRGTSFQNDTGKAATARTFALADRGAAGQYFVSLILSLVGGVLFFACGVGLSVAAHRMKVAADRAMDAGRRRTSPLRGEGT